ncbi:glycosyltransferase [Shewanella glacialipiscicola]|uniref:glycosyltransferase n=1 Tax=Shewanella glacialipiscicola TaxID=614069 RepID=UPI0021D83743|nr:glycosyltransferase [Shewanella glacialipiscicola]MCU7995602.1 glycosyltransferase [Shewanella glacialipiscicola]MCU8026849.1 glycosyltransferase [Shewanella glacialipiscicola]
MTVIHIFSALYQGGAENQFEQIFANSNSQDRHVVLSLKNIRTEFATRLEGKGIVVHFLDFRGLGLLIGIFSCRKLIRSYLNEDKSTVVQCWMYHANIIGWLATLFVDIPIVWSIRRTAIPKGVTGLLARGGALIARMSKFRIISNSNAGRLSHIAVGYPTRIEVIGNGFECVPERQKSELNIKNAHKGVFSFVHVGRYAPVKGHETMLNASINFLESLSETEREKVTFTFIGRGVEEALATVLKESSLTGHFLFLGEIPSPRNVLSQYSCYVLSSLSEGFPNSLVEAMLEGMPCIASNVGDVAEIIESNDFLYSSEHVNELTRLLTKMYSTSASERVEIGAKNKALATEKYDVVNVREKYNCIYKEAIN